MFLIKLWLKVLAAIWTATFKATKSYRPRLPEWVGRTSVYTAIAPYIPLVRRLLLAGFCLLFVVLFLASNWSR